MIFKNKNKLLKNKGNVLQSAASMTFNVDTAVFPQYRSDGSTAKLNLFFTQQVAVTIDYGDGSSATTIAQAYGGRYAWGIGNRGPQSNVQLDTFALPFHTYTDGKANHVVRVFYAPEYLQSFYIFRIVLPAQDFSFGFSKHPNLAAFTMQETPVVQNVSGGCFLSLDLVNIQYCTKLTDMTIGNCFYTTSPFYGSIPLPLLDAPLELISFGDAGFVGKSFAASKMDQLAVRACKDTLQSLTTNYRIVDNNLGTEGPFPANWATIPNLRSLNFYQNSYTVMPSLLNSMPLLTFLAHTGNTNLTSYGSLTALTALTDYIFSTCSALPAHVPSYLHLMTKIKNIVGTSVFLTDRAGSIDTFISELYDVAVSLAARTGPASGTWRGIALNISYASGGQATTLVPGGTYRKPAGYVAGTSNGTPASSLERLWVLDNQYLWASNWNGK